MKDQLNGHSVVQMSKRGGNGDEKEMMGEEYLRVDFLFGCVMDVRLDE